MKDALDILNRLRGTDQSEESTETELPQQWRSDLHQRVCEGLRGMGRSDMVPGALQMPLGMMFGFIDHNINKMPEDKLRQKLQETIDHMQSWLG